MIKMKKDGEPSAIYKGLAHLIFILFIIYIITIFFLHPEFFGSGKITGYAVYDSTEAKQKIETAFSGASFMNAISNANFCIQIKDNDTEHVFKVRKTPTGISIANSYDYCDGQLQEDVIVKFASYDAFAELMDDFTIFNIVVGMNSFKYQILDSRIIKPGGDVVCDDAFKAKFCNAVSQFGTPEELIEGDLYCCLDAMTNAQRNLLEQHLRDTGFQNEIQPVSETPSAGFLSSYYFYAILGVLVLLGVSVFIFRRRPGAKISAPAGAAPSIPPSAAAPPIAPPEDPRITALREYVAGTLNAGYSPEQVYQALLQQGWGQDVLNDIFTKTSSQTEQQPQVSQQSSGPTGPYSQ
ncbi:MAG: hypothetical protein KJ574_00760 [Nanoarchaeota archaeon]|nr:hypothetical protein [Nanoarchaeota archaeon]